MSGSTRRERGQVSSEALGVLFVIALIIGALVASGLAGRIAEGISEAICRILGGSCDSGQLVAGEPERCLLSSTTTTSRAEVFVALVEVGKESTLVKEIHSDGSVTYTVVDNNSLAAKGMIGLKGKVGRFGASLSAEATAGGMFEGARVYELPNQAAAEEFEKKVQAAGGFDGILRNITHADDKIFGIDNPLGGVNDWALDQLGVDDDEDLPEPDATYLSTESFLQGNAEAAGGVGGIDAELALAIERSGGVRTYTSGPRKGEAEVFGKLGATTTGRLTSTLFGVGVGGDVSAEGLVMLTLGKGMEPKEVSIRTTLGYTGDVDLTAQLQGKDAKAVSKLLKEAAITGSSGKGEQVVVESKLDLTDPANRAAVMRLLSLDPLEQLDAARDLGLRFRDHGTLSIDTSTTEESEGGASLKVGAGLGGGGGLTTSEQSEERTAGLVRPPGGTWMPRVCKGPPAE